MVPSQFQIVIQRNKFLNMHKNYKTTNLFYVIFIILSIFPSNLLFL